VLDLGQRVASRAYIVERMPRSSGTRCGVNVTSRPRNWIISAVWRWPKSPYAATLPWFSQKCVRSEGALPAPDTPDFASMMTSPPSRSRPASASGCRARSDAVG
jgi:hypothetical protein